VTDDNGSDLPKFPETYPDLVSIQAQDVDPNKPPAFSGQGDCCQPTDKCHAYVKWVLDMQNGKLWQSPEQEDEAMAHLECCMRQYRASCANPMSGPTIVWRDPSQECSPTNNLTVAVQNKGKRYGPVYN
jgi:hypothetical protein